MPSINFTAPEIEKLLKDLQFHKASGPDEIPAVVLKEAASVLAEFLFSFPTILQYWNHS